MTRGYSTVKIVLEGTQPATPVLGDTHRSFRSTTQDLSGPIQIQDNPRQIQSRGLCSFPKIEVARPQTYLSDRLRVLTEDKEGVGERSKRNPSQLALKSRSSDILCHSRSPSRTRSGHLSDFDILRAKNVYAPTSRFPQCVHGGNTMASLSTCLLYTSPSPRDGLLSRMPSSA